MAIILETRAHFVVDTLSEIVTRIMVNISKSNTVYYCDLNRWNSTNYINYYIRMQYYT